PVYKALSAVRMAREAEKLGISCVPVFWLATEDHDLEEVNQAHLPNADGSLDALGSATQAKKKDEPVGRIGFGAEISETVSRAAGLLGESEASRLLAECYRPGEAFGTGFANLFTRVYCEYCVKQLYGLDDMVDR